MSLLTTAEAARLLKVSEDWCREHAGDLGAIRLGGPRSPLRFELDAIERWKEAQRLARVPEAPPRQKPGPRRAPSGVELVPLPPNARREIPELASEERGH